MKTIIFSFCLALCQAQAAPAPNLIGPINRYLKDFPTAQAQDVYKMLYQAEFGLEHMLLDPAAAYKYLLDELAQVEASDKEPLLAGLVSSSDVVRVNLRAFKHRRLPPSVLMEVMIISAATIKGHAADFKSTWEAVLAGVRQGWIPLPVDDVAIFSQAMQARGYPPAHHSQAFREAYWPAYRVVRRDVFSAAFPNP